VCAQPLCFTTAVSRDRNGLTRNGAVFRGGWACNIHWGHIHWGGAERPRTKEARSASQWPQRTLLSTRIIYRCRPSIQFAVVLEQHPAHPFEFGADLCCWRRHRLKRLGRVGDEAKHVKRHSALCRTSSRALNECGRQIDAQGGDLPGRAAVLAQVAAKPSQSLK
jgi:hypothetical protein